MQTLRAAMLSLLAFTPFQPVFCASPLSIELQCEHSFQNEDYDRAYEYCNVAASQGHVHSQWLLANCHEHGFGTERDLYEAKFWYEKAALQNHITAQLHLGKLYSKGMQNDYVKAFQFFSLAAAQNEPEAQFLVSLCYQNGMGVLANPQQALYWYQLAAKNGLEGAKLLSERQLRPSDKPDISTGVLAFNKAQKLKSKKTKDSHPENDYFTWLTLSAEEGHPLAQFELAQSYLNGHYLAIDDNYAINWLQKAAQSNYGKAQSYLAWIYAINSCDETNLAKANSLFLQARYKINQDNEMNAAYAAKKPVLQAKLSSEIYGSHQTLFEKARKLIESSSELAQHPQALQLLSEIAEQNYIPAQLYLAQLYQLGDKIEKNKSKAARLYEKAAQLGSAEAQYTLGWLYYYGDGVTPNHQKAIAWLQAAANSGFNQSTDAIQFIKTLNSSSQSKRIAKK